MKLQQPSRDSQECILAVFHPEYLIESIAEQGYTLESAIADLVDNSIAANCNNVEILVDSAKEPFQVFICDNGNGMTRPELESNSKYPSSVVAQLIWPPNKRCYAFSIAS